MIYTSYYKFINKYDIPHSKCIAISRVIPNDFTGDNYKHLMPYHSMIYKLKNDKMNINDYMFEYNLILEKVNPSEIYNRFDGKILLCYEKTGFCHRHIVSKYMKDVGFGCKELGLKDLEEMSNVQ